ncbi:hypothetical protein GCM10025882_01940 [Acinetobacter gyllenbergii]|uniref:Uncharacterized protein n=1 Tax=Acinetobacter gyllenbergii CIP 110306 = MTCC 11365 TaxID=1217657 RepID=A0A829HDH4_9GAMM|nr:hypothetical protein [Acinetobacter gyllenbergii]EPF75021.1 hypothetical protein F957_03217 [Acinetobacter gyllenbergii CIP 110306 = MTCC 11365]EPH32583.1 hypothetical protein L293_1367 [Acinetobacter gyllenbergii CIP 110306 = MTCC 11365]GMA09770.1 hypothetical protein GCM10025882_01940 [Acinetobacter gyllenbergii]
MTVFKNDLIDELEAELLNQYLRIVWLEDYLSNGLDHLGLHVTCAVDEKSNPRTVQDLLKLATDIKVTVTGKKDLGSQCFQEQFRFTEEEYNDIYQAMGESNKDPRYDFIKEYGYSVSDLTGILDQLATLRKELHKLDDKEKLKTYKEILHNYIGLDTLVYGIKNPSLKQRIAKGRSSQGEYQKIVKAKKCIFFNLLIEQTKDGSKYKNVSQAVNHNIDEVMRQFQIFDEGWIHLKREISRVRILKLKQQQLNETLTASELRKIEEEIVKLSTLMQQLEDGLNHGYPFESLDNILPYNTTSLDDVLMKALRLEKTIKEQCIEPS